MNKFWANVFSNEIIPRCLVEWLLTLEVEYVNVYLKKTKSYNVFQSRYLTDV